MRTTPVRSAAAIALRSVHVKYRPYVEYGYGVMIGGYMEKKVTHCGLIYIEPTRTIRLDTPH